MFGLDAVSHFGVGFGQGPMSSCAQYIAHTAYDAVAMTFSGKQSSIHPRGRMIACVRSEASRGLEPEGLLSRAVHSKPTLDSLPILSEEGSK